MPRTEVRFFKDDAGKAPLVDWLEDRRRRERKAYAKCASRIGMLASLGHELRRPMADYLRDGVYELRVRHGHVNYRILYFFHGQAVAVLTHALIKEADVPDADIERAIQCKEAFDKNPKRHTYDEEPGNAQDKRCIENHRPHHWR